MSWRLNAVLVAAVSVVVLLLAVPASAYRIEGKRWPGATISIWNAAPQYAAPLAQAKAAWNGSGARIRFVTATSRARANVVVTLDPTLRDNGRAQVGYGRATHYGARLRLKPSLAPHVATGTLTHELGHILGLGHVASCAQMHPFSESACRPMPQEGEYRCRLLEADDVVGAVRLYGGRARPIEGPTVCPVPPAVPAPLDLTAVEENGAVTLRWRNPSAASLTRVVILRATGSCPTPGDESRLVVAEVEGAPGSAATAVDYSLFGPGRHCYVARSLNRYGGYGPAATAWVEYTGS